MADEILIGKHSNERRSVSGWQKFNSAVNVLILVFIGYGVTRVENLGDRMGHVESRTSVLEKGDVALEETSKKTRDRQVINEDRITKLEDARDEFRKDMEEIKQNQKEIMKLLQQLVFGKHLSKE